MMMSKLEIPAVDVANIVSTHIKSELTSYVEKTIHDHIDPVIKQMATDIAKQVCEDACVHVYKSNDMRGIVPNIVVEFVEKKVQS
jgi:hypothetical protein